MAAQTSPHSCVLAPALKLALSAGIEGKYGRMFPDLPSCDADEPALLRLGSPGSPIDVGVEPDVQGMVSDNPAVPAGYPILGQFIAHDITADRSLLQHHANIDELRNFRTPRLDLELLYAAGPTGNPYIYDNDDADMFLIGLNDAGKPDDLPRNQQGRALIGDQRDDVHLIISQLHLAFLKFHNQVVDYLRKEGVPRANVFDEAQRLVRWHYQWIVIHEFLPLSVGDALVDDILRNGPRFYSYAERPFIPVEFADAAYRFGHSQINPTYRLNDTATGRIFPEWAGARPVPHDRVVDWRYFYPVDGQHPPQPSKRIDTRIVHPMIDLPATVVGETDLPAGHSIAYRDLQRGRALDLPSGEAVARAMGIEPLSKAELGLDALAWRHETPLWYYVLMEAEVRTGGERLGEVGGRIVAEVLLGLIDGDPQTYRSVAPDWRPTLPAARPGSFTMADLLVFARVVSNDSPKR